ncbi:glycosyltransferase, partial [candidate division KSB1 bacterium]
TGHGGNLHCERVPKNLNGKSIDADVKVIHLGYMYEENRYRKYLWNKEKDPVHAGRGYYEHLLDQPGMILKDWRERPFMVAKDVPDVTVNSSAKQEIKPEYYYANARKNLVDLVPVSAQRVLDVGCGQGMTGGLLRSTRGIEVVGIEIHPDVAESARQHLSRVLTGDLETMELPFAEGYFDAIMLGDILEHLVDPWTALKKLTRYLHADGTIIASIPNIRNLGIVKKLLEGTWTYEEWGILDKTHLRFFALKNMQDLFESAGIEAKVAEVVRDPLFEKEMAMPPQKTIDVDTGKMMLRAVSPQELDELTAQQFIFTGKLVSQSAMNGKKIEHADQLVQAHENVPTVSVVIPVYNNLNYTRQCVTSLFGAREKAGFEVIMVDNGSDDGTPQYLRQLPPPVRVVTLPENLGFAKGCNAGAREARGKYIVFLNNDTTVEPNWLSAMIECIERNPQIGLVGNLQIFPDSGRVQQAGIVCGPDKMVYSIYNNQIPADHPAVNKPREFQFIAGSCFLMEREFFNALDGFDESYLNSCEDVDLCMRVREAGKKVYYCPQSRIYHYESRTVKSHDKNSENYRLFLKRWGEKMFQDDLNYLTEDGMLPQKPAVADVEKRSEDAVVMTENTKLPSREEKSFLKVGILTTYNQRCGLAGYAQSLVEALRKHGIDPLIFAEKSSELLGLDEPNVFRCWTRSPDGGADVARLILDHNVNVLHVNHGGIFPLDGWLIAVLQRIREQGVRVVITFHTTEAVAEEFGMLCRLADHVYVHHSQNMLELVAIGAPAKRIEQIPIGMAPVTREDLFECKLALGWDPAVKVVSTFGFVEPHKGVLELIEAMKPLHARIQARLHVLGIPHPDNPDSQIYMEVCKAKVQELGLADYVWFSNEYLPEEEVARLLRASDVIVMNYASQRYESSAAAMFALSTGRPVVSSSVPTFELPEAVTFKLTEQYNLAQAIYVLLANPFVTRAVLDNVLRFEKTARWEVIAGRIAETYRRVAEQPMQSDVHLLKYYRTHPDDIYAEPLQRERVRWLKSKAEGRILEIGPATGYVSEFVGAAAAADINRGRLAVCEVLRPDTKFYFGNVFEGLLFKDKEFDQVHAPEILEHVDFDQAVVALRECARVGKRVILTLPNADKPNYNPDLVHNIEHRWIVNRHSIERLLRETGCTNYELDASPGLDFYLLDIRTDTTAPRSVVLERAAKLHSFNLDPGEPIQVGVDMSALEDSTSRARGIGRYMLNQFKELMAIRPNWTFTAFGVSPSPQFKEVHEFAELANGGYLRWGRLPERMPDVLYLPHPMGVAGKPILESIFHSDLLVACTFYDLVPLIFSDEYLRLDPKFGSNYLSQLELIQKRCDLFLCISQATAQDLQVRLQLPQARLRIIHAGVGDQFTPEPDALLTDKMLQMHGLQKGRFLLFVGVPDQRKNPVGLFMSLSAARQVMQSDLRLVLAGDIPSQYITWLKKLASDCALPETAVCFAGKVSDDELNVLYHTASALLFPSRYEGFGFPIIEAMSSGLPVIAGNNSSQAEVFEGAAVLVNASKPESIARGILDLQMNSDLQNEMRRKGLELCRRYTWRKVAEKTAMYLAESVAQRGMKRQSAKTKSRERVLA